MSEAKNAEAELISLIEDGVKSITLCEAEDESSYTILDAIADTLGDKDIKRASEMVGDHAAYIAAAILAAGYAKREVPEADTLALIEVAARAIKPNAFAALDEFRAFSGKGRYIDRQIMLLEEECQGARSAADAAIYAIRSPKGQP